jgi:hypothetical protein
MMCRRSGTLGLLSLPAAWALASACDASETKLSHGILGILQSAAATDRQAASACVSVPSGVVAWWTADGNARDVVGSNHGSLQDSASFGEGQVGDAFHLDGITDAIVVPNTPDLNPSTELTIEAWILPTEDSGAPDAVGIIVNKEGEITQYELGRRNSGHCGIPIGNLAFFLAGLTGLPDECNGWVDGNAFLPLNMWTHVALTFDGTIVQVYTNGALTRQITTGGTLPISTGSFRIGGRNVPLPEFPTFGFWNGKIDEVTLYSRALLPDEISRIFSAGGAGKCKPNSAFDINLTTFIPGNHIKSPPQWFYKCALRGNHPLYFEGDTRSFDPDAVSFRTRQLVTVVPDESIDADGVDTSSPFASMTGLTRSFASDALPTIEPSDVDGVLRDCHLLHESGQASTSNMEILVVRVNSKSVLVHLNGSAVNPLVALAASIDWNLELEIDVSTEPPTWTLNGIEDGFPAFELYVNDERIYERDAPPPYSWGDLRKLFDGDGDRIVNRAGELPSAQSGRRSRRD